MVVDEFNVRTPGRMATVAVVSGAIDCFSQFTGGVERIFVNLCALRGNFRVSEPAAEIVFILPAIERLICAISNSCREIEREPTGVKVECQVYVIPGGRF